MNSKQDKTLEAIYEVPTRRDILWADVKSLIGALGGTVRNGDGSRRRITLNGQKGNVHEPHDGRLKRYAVEDLRELLGNAGVYPP